MLCPCSKDALHGISHRNQESMTRRSFVASAAAGAYAAVPTTGCAQSRAPTSTDDVIFARGRVIDPQTGLDAIRDVKIGGPLFRIAADL